MSADPFNSVGGYSVGIPPIPVIDINGNVTSNSLHVGNSYSLNDVVTFNAVTGQTTDNVTDQVLYSTISSTVSSIEYTIVGTDSMANTRQTTKLISSVLGNDVEYFEFGTIDINGGVGDFKAQYNMQTNTVDLTVTPYTNNQIDYKILITTYGI